MRAKNVNKRMKITSGEEKHQSRSSQRKRLRGFIL